MKHRVEVTTTRVPDSDPPPGYQDPDLWFQTHYRLACEGRVYFAWAYEKTPATANLLFYHEDGADHSFGFISYRDRTFCRVARYLLSTIGIRKLLVWCENRPVLLEAQRLKY